MKFEDCFCHFESLKALYALSNCLHPFSVESAVHEDSSVVYKLWRHERLEHAYTPVPVFPTVSHLFFLVVVFSDVSLRIIN